MGPRALGGMGQWGFWGLFRSHSEWRAIPSGCHSERQPFRMASQHKWTCLRIVFVELTTPAWKARDLRMGLLKDGWKASYRFVLTTPSESTVGQTMFWLSTFRSRNVY